MPESPPSAKGSDEVSPKQRAKAEQEQFLHVLDRDEAERRFRAAIDATPRDIERIPLDAALGRVLAIDVLSPVDVPSFDRSNVDGFAVVAEDTFGASEEHPHRVRLVDEVIHTGVVPTTAVRRGEAVAIATGGMMPRGADAVVMVEYSDVSEVRGQRSEVRIHRAVTAGANVSFAGTDITAGETVLRRGQLLTSRDTGVLAAVGVADVDVWRKPIVAILSTGDEIIPPGDPMRPARVYDSNAQVLADAVRELGGDPRRLGIAVDDEDELRGTVHDALEIADIVLLSGGTSKGAGDVSYRVVAELTDPGIVAHGVALKPGKPICLAATRGTPVIVLPGFPTSAIFTFYEFVAPVLTAMAGRTIEQRGVVQAKLAVRVNSEIGRTEYLLVSLVPGVAPAISGRLKAAPTTDPVSGGLKAAPTTDPLSGRLKAAPTTDPVSGRLKAAPTTDPVSGRPKAAPTTDPVSRDPVGAGFSRPEMAGVATLTAYPMGQGSGSVTTFSRADGFTTLERHQEIVEAGTIVNVQLLGRELQLADLVVIGSHCIGLDYLLGELQKDAVRPKFLAVGSQAGLDAAKRGECDIAGIHLLDPKTGDYNRPFVTPDLQLIRGYGRLQGIVFRKGDVRFEGRSAADAVAAATSDPSCVMVNRNQGSGTRALIDRLLSGAKPPGYAVQPRTHNAVAAAVVQGRADWGMTLDTIARSAGLGFIPVQHEQYDFVTPKSRAERPGVRAFLARLADPVVREALTRLGMVV